MTVSSADLTPEVLAGMTLRNRVAITEAGFAGCFFCFGFFGAKEVKEFDDKGETAICPRCDVDALVPGIVDMGAMMRAHERWFTEGSEHEQEARA
jgi:hypothetical protein